MPKQPAYLKSTFPEEQVLTSSLETSPISSPSSSVLTITTMPPRRVFTTILLFLFYWVVVSTLTSTLLATAMLLNDWDARWTPLVIRDRKRTPTLVITIVVSSFATFYTYLKLYVWTSLPPIYASAISHYSCLNSSIAKNVIL